MPEAPGPVPHFEGVSAIAGRYDGFIVDVWGVLHDGVTLYPGAVDALDRLAEAGKRFVMLTNAPRRSAAVVEAMIAMGMPGRHCRNILSSGEATFSDLVEKSAPFYAGAGDRFIHIGPDRDRGLFEGVGWAETEAIEKAGLIVNTGPWEDGETVSDYEPLLADAAARRIPMVCANPDLMVVRGGRRIICAGALAERYEELGAAVRYLGKPRAEIYDYCFRALPGIERSRIAAIGDSFRTDLVGARNVGVDPVLVADGMHAPELLAGGSGTVPDAQAMARLGERWNVKPAASLPSFRW